MGYILHCLNKECETKTFEARNIVDLISKYVGRNYLFICPICKSEMYIEKHFKLQEKGETWNPYLRGIIPLGENNDTYQPFIYLVSGSPNGQIDSCWFCYYKDTRKQGGILKLGYGPGGPPVLSIEQIKKFVETLKELKIMVTDTTSDNSD